MKDKENTTTLTRKKKDILVFSEKTKHLFSKEDIQLAESIKNRMPTSKKYLSTQKEAVISSVKKLYKKHPETPLKNVLIHILQTMPDFLTAENLLKVVGYIFCLRQIINKRISI